VKVQAVDGMVNPVISTRAHVVRISDRGDRLGRRGGGATGGATGTAGSNLGRGVRRSSSTGRPGGGGATTSSRGRRLRGRRGTS
jgi:hypothetical protein